jgi:HPt (histidine-containing phosphotransfer) domain-containing protein
MLQLFAEGRGNVLAEIDAALAAGDRMRAAAAVHAIRGAAGNVGAETLMRIAGDIETALRRTDRDPPGDLLSLFKQEFSIVKEGIQNALRETDEETAGAGRALPDRVRTERLIEQLEDLLEKDLPRALEAFRELERILRGEVFMSVVTELRKRLDRFDTEGAKEKLRDIRGMLNR